MNEIDPVHLIPIGGGSLVGLFGVALFGDTGLVIDTLAGGGLGAIAGNLVVLRRRRARDRARAPEIVAAWTAGGAAFTFLIHLLVELL